MSSSNNEIVERFEMAFAAQDLAAIIELLDPALIDHNAPPDQKPGLAGWKESFDKNSGVFTDLQVSLHHVIGEGDVVATHWTLSGIHAAEFMGIPATGRSVAVEGMNFYRVTGGRIAEMWMQLDPQSVKDQLGAPSS